MLSIHDSDYFCYTRIKWTESITVQLNHITVTWTVLYRDVLLTPELLPAIRSIGDVFVFQQDNAPAHRARDTVELLRCETAHFISPDMWPANSRDLNPVYCCNWDMMQKRVYQVPIRDTDELRQRLVETRADFQYSVVDDAINQWHKRPEACVHTDCGHLEHFACLTFKLPHNTTRLFRATFHQTNELCISQKKTAVTF